MRAYYQEFAECLTGQGLPSQLLETGDGIFVDTGDSDSDRESYAFARTTCEQQVGQFPDPPPPPTDEELRWLYAENVQVAACLRDHGFAVVEAPSEEVFVETYRASLSGGPAPWHPYPADISGEAERACPQVDLVERYQG
ncbi:hypothetical protein DV701_02780 [Ornithinimicrobium avium]|uniref:Uncharacterized protein n=1 Tax=Ornithinimicrobium avium TaxID=2283195 RepID=A0A345NJK0_9MICO|nr:hypothetical protein DV701_02780 [Ornithinimicrobium avium]